MGSSRDHDLPPTLELVVNEVSEEAALRLARAFGGREVYMASNPGPDHPLTHALGKADAVSVSRVLGPGHVLIPFGPYSALSARKRAIREGLASGLSAREIVRRVGCCERTVRRHRAIMRAEGSLPTVPARLPTAARPPRDEGS